MVPNRGENKKVYRKLLSNFQFVQRTGYTKYKEFQIHDLTLEEIKMFHLLDFPDQSIPTLEEYLSHARQFDLHRPIAIDLKGLETNEAKYLLASIATSFLRDYLQKINIIFEYDYQMIGPLVFLASPRVFRNFVVEDDAQQYLYSHDTYIPIFYKGRYRGYLMSFEPQRLFFFSEKISATSSVHDKTYTGHQESLTQCMTALH